MEITYFIRNNNNEYPELCSKATVKLQKNNQIYYGGVQWGNIQPSNCVIYMSTLLDSLSFDDWIEKNGYKRVIEEEV